MRIGKLSQATATPVDTIRHYEREGLLRPPARSEANYRVYTAADAERLHFIRRCRALDMNLAEIRGLLALQDGGSAEPHSGAHALLEEHIGHVSDRITALQELQAQLLELRGRCASPEPGQPCGILEGLAEPGGVAVRRSHVGHSH